MTQKISKGSVRFILLYEDENLTVPIIQTVIFLEERQDTSGALRYLFKEIGPRNEEHLFEVADEHFDDLVIDRVELSKRLVSDSL